MPGVLGRPGRPGCWSPRPPGVARYLPTVDVVVKAAWSPSFGVLWLLRGDVCGRLVKDRARLWIRRFVKPIVLIGDVG